MDQKEWAKEQHYWRHMLHCARMIHEGEKSATLKRIQIAVIRIYEVEFERHLKKKPS